MSKFLIFLVALAGGVAVAVIAGGGTWQDVTGLASPAPIAQAQIHQTQGQVQTQTRDHPIFTRSVGRVETMEFVETCTAQRCRCNNWAVQEWVATPGHVAAQTPNATSRTLAPGASCPPINGSPGGLAVRGDRSQCVVCPADMTYSGLIRGGDAIVARWQAGGHLCVRSTRRCID